MAKGNSRYSPVKAVTGIIASAAIALGLPHALEAITNNYGVKPMQESNARIEQIATENELRLQEMRLATQGLRQIQSRAASLEQRGQRLRNQNQVVDYGPDTLEDMQMIVGQVADYQRDIDALLTSMEHAVDRADNARERVSESVASAEVEGERLVGAYQRFRRLSNATKKSVPISAVAGILGIIASWLRWGRKRGRNMMYEDIE